MKKTYSFNIARIEEYVRKVNSHKNFIPCEIQGGDFFRRRMIGKLGEVAFGLEFNVINQLNLEVYSGRKGDGKFDFKLPEGTVDIKSTSRHHNPWLLLPKKEIDRLVTPPTFYSLVVVHSYSVKEGTIEANIKGFLRSEDLKFLAKEVNLRYNPSYKIESHDLSSTPYARKTLSKEERPSS